MEQDATMASAPIWQHPNMLDDMNGSYDGGSSPASVESELQASAASSVKDGSHSRAASHKTESPAPTPDSTRDHEADPTDSDQKARSNAKKDSKQGDSSGATPGRDGYTTPFTNGASDAARTRSVTSSARTPKRESKAPTPISTKSGTGYDPKDLLSPKKGRGAQKETEDANADDEADQGPVSIEQLYSDLHNVTKRTDAPVKRRQKVEPDEEENKPSKKGKFEIHGGGGVVSDFLKEENEKEAKEMSDPAALSAALKAEAGQAVKDKSKEDLEADVEKENAKAEEKAKSNDEDGFEIVGEQKAKDIEVCLGKLEVEVGFRTGPYILLSNIPHPKPGALQQSTDRTGQWPPIHLTFRYGGHLLLNLLDPTGRSVGNLDPATAKALLPLIQAKGKKDDSLVTIRMRLDPRKKRPNEQPGDPCSETAKMTIRLFSPRSRAVAIGKHLKSYGVMLRNVPVGMGVLYNPHDATTWVPKNTQASGNFSILATAQSNVVTRTHEEVKADFENMFDTLTKSTDSLQEAPQPVVVKTEMLPHQKQGLYFMTEREKDRGIPSEGDTDEFHLWKSRVDGNGRKLYYNVITGTETKHRPTPVLGGILADMMGLGKTLSILALVVSSMTVAVQHGNLRPTMQPTGFVIRPAQATLLVCPLSTVQNWEKQIQDHIKDGALSYHIYHGSGRMIKPEELAKFDLVITTYQTVQNDQRRAEAPLFRLKWFRIALDEAHQIRNSTTQVANAICDLKAMRRWAVTGTPVQNRLDDLGSLIKFLRIQPFDEKGAFQQFILAPFKLADAEILPKLRLLVDSITLRRVKDTIDLPPREMNLVELEMSADELKLYMFFVKDSMMKVKALTSGARLGGGSYAHVLKAIMRVRLICAHGEELLNDEDRKLLEGTTKDNAIEIDDEDEEVPVLSKKQAFEMFELLKGAGLDQCPMCNKQIKQRIGEDDEEDNYEIRKNTNVIGHMTSCYHIICPECWPEFEDDITQQMGEDPDASQITCKFCANAMKPTQLPLLQTELDEEAEARARLRKNPKLARQMGFYRGPHTKTKELIKKLKEFEEQSHRKPKEPPIKSVVFSAWTNHLDLIQIALEANNISYTRLDGSMSRKNRSAAMDSFSSASHDSPIVILVSIGAGGLGLNLTAANKVFMMEPQFNPAAEAQAVDRVHRLGQKRDVQIFRFVMHDSFEMKMLEMQEKKLRLADLTVGKKMSREEMRMEKLETLKSLFK